MDFSSHPSPDDLLILLAAARLGRFTAVAESLGITHTTVSRRIAALDAQLGGPTLDRTPHGWELTDLGRAAVAAAEGIEASLGSLSGALAGSRRTAHGTLSGLVRVAASDAFGSHFVAPALTQLQREHPELRVELLCGTRPLSQNRSGVDVEMVPAAVESPRTTLLPLAKYALRLYCSRGYARERGVPSTVAELPGHRLVSYAENILQVTDLGVRHFLALDRAPEFQSTSIFAQVQAVRQGAGIGLLPPFLFQGDPDIVHVLPGAVEHVVEFSAGARPEALRSPRGACRHRRRPRRAAAATGRTRPALRGPGARAGVRARSRGNVLSPAPTVRYGAEHDITGT